MRVVQYGRIKPRYASCTRCGAILEFDERDVKMSNVHLAKGPQHDGEDYYVNCPVCATSIYDGMFKDSAEEC